MHNQLQRGDEPALLPCRRSGFLRRPEVVNGIRGALDFISSEYHLPSIDNLPYSNSLIPLSVFFASPATEEVALADGQRRTINRWFWRASFSGRYSAGVLRHLDADVAEARKLRVGTPSQLDNIPAHVTADFFLQNKFLLSSVNTKAFVAVLAQQRPRNFVSGSLIDLRIKLQRYNRKEFHHLMPKAFLTSSGQTRQDSNLLANFCFIARADNRAIGGVAPSLYRQHMAEPTDEILQSHLCPYALFDDQYEPFLQLRSHALADKVDQLLSQTA